MRAKKLILMEKIEEVGLWKSEEEVRAKLHAISDEKSKVKLLALQIQFQKVVLSAFHPDKEVFQLSAKGEKFDSARLCRNLVKILQKPDDSADETETVPEESSPLPSVIPREDFEKQKLIYQELANNPDGNKKKRNLEPSSDQHGNTKKRKIDNNHLMLFEIHTPEDLLGKRVKHLCQSAMMQSGLQGRWCR